jgi:hypothetical protein
MEFADEAQGKRELRQAAKAVFQSHDVVPNLTRVCGGGLRIVCGAQFFLEQVRKACLGTFYSRGEHCFLPHVRGN